MELEIKDKKSLLYISGGDILADCFSPYDAYLVNFNGFDGENKTLYKLISLSGNNKNFGDKEQSSDDVKQLIMDNKLTHYSSDEYSLSLVKKRQEEDII